MQRQQNIRLNGAEFDAIMYGISEEQKEILEENPTVEHYGVVMVSGVMQKRRRTRHRESVCCMQMILTGRK